MTNDFRITAWPGNVVPVPQVDSVTATREGDWLVYEPNDWSTSDRDMPSEFYLREAVDVDLDDLDEIVALVNRCGPLTPMTDLRADLPRGSDVAIIRDSVILGRSYHGPTDHPANRVHLDEVVFRIRALRVLGNHAIAYRQGEYEHEAWPDIQSTGALVQRQHQAWRHFAEYVSAALSIFHVRIWADLGDPDLDVGRPHPTVYQAAVLQIVNDIVEDVDYRTCPRCNRTFARQVGRSSQQSRLKGVTYCSSTCANAAAQQKYRDRAKQRRITK